MAHGWSRSVRAAAPWALVPALTALVAADGPPGAGSGCSHALLRLSGEGHSDLELAAYCRANLPPDVCRDASGTLGEQPWAPDRIAALCERWDGRWAGAAPARQAQASGFENLQPLLEECMQKKAAAGICKDPNSGGPLPLDQCAAEKAKEYPEQTKKIQEALAIAMSHMGQAQDGQLLQSSEQLGPVATSRRLSKGTLAALAFVVASFSAASLVSLRRLLHGGRHPEHSPVLLGSASESDA